MKHEGKPQLGSWLKGKILGKHGSLATFARIAHLDSKRLHNQLTRNSLGKDEATQLIRALGEPEVNLTDFEFKDSRATVSTNPNSRIRFGAPAYLWASPLSLGNHLHGHSRWPFADSHATGPNATISPCWRGDSTKSDPENARFFDRESLLRALREGAIDVAACIDSRWRELEGAQNFDVVLKLATLPGLAKLCLVARHGSAVAKEIEQYKDCGVQIPRILHLLKRMPYKPTIPVFYIANQGSEEQVRRLLISQQGKKGGLVLQAKPIEFQSRENFRCEVDRVAREAEPSLDDAALFCASEPLLFHLLRKIREQNPQLTILENHFVRPDAPFEVLDINAVELISYRDRSKSNLEDTRNQVIEQLKETVSILQNSAKQACISLQSLEERQQEEFLVSNDPNLNSQIVVDQRLIWISKYYDIPLGRAVRAINRIQYRMEIPV